jgi:hypothetical protein
VVTIGEFILARVDDDAFLAQRIARGRVREERRADDETTLATWDPWRVLASCTVRRDLVLNHRVGAPTLHPCGCGRPDSVGPPCHTMRALALEWSAHPDYQAAWRAHPVPRQARSA